MENNISNVMLLEMVLSRVNNVKFISTADAETGIKMAEKGRLAPALPGFRMGWRFLLPSTWKSA